MNSAPGVNVVAHADRNLIEINFRGAIGLAEIDQYEQGVTQAIKLVQKAFSLLGDLTELESMDRACIPSIERTMDKLRLGGIGRVVRVIPRTSQDIGLSIMSLFHYPRGLPIVTCNTRAEAEQALR